MSRATNGCLESADRGPERVKRPPNWRLPGARRAPRGCLEGLRRANAVHALDITPPIELVALELHSSLLANSEKNGHPLGGYIRD